MTVLELRLIGDPVLRSVADPIDVSILGEAAANSEDSSVRAAHATLASLVAGMFETMDKYRGVGLAANQVGVTRRVFVFDCEGDRGHVINPEWEAVGEETVTDSEGCLSIPEVRGDVTRSARVRLRGHTLEGETVDREVSGLLARCVQHETDHLNGVLFLKHLAPEQRKAAMRELRSSGVL